MDLEKGDPQRNLEGEMGSKKQKLFIQKNFNSFDTVNKQNVLQVSGLIFSNLF